MMHIKTELYPEAVVLHLESRFDFHAMDPFLTALSQAEKALDTLFWTCTRSPLLTVWR